MKLFLIFLIILCFGSVGYFYKVSIKKENEKYKFLLDYVRYLNANITLFKRDIIEINNNFKIMQKNKTANNIPFNLNNISNNQYLDNFNDKIVQDFLTSLGQNEYEFEKEKIIEFEKYVLNKVDKLTVDIKNKGDLFFKIMLSIGAVIGILIW